MKNLDKSTLMAYLYGELSAAETAEVEQYLEENTAAKAEWTRLSSTRLWLGQLKDEPVTEPLVVARVWAKSQATGWQKWAAVAAVLIMGVLGAAWLQVRVSFRNQELTIGFGETASVAVQPPASGSQRQMTRSNPSVAPKIVSFETAKPPASDSVALHRIALLEQKLQRQMQELRLQQLALQTKQPGLTTEQVTDVMSELQQENFETMQQLLLTANQQQQLYSQKKLTQLTDYLASQRKEDLQKINAVLNTIVQNTDQKQQQTDIVLTQVISKLNEKSTKQKN